MRRTAALLIVAATAVVLTLLLATGGADTLELPLRDAALRLLPIKPATSTVVVAIDETSIRRDGPSPWPWPRDFIAQVVDRIAAAGARGLVIDVLLTDSRPNDEQLATAIRKLPTITVAAVDERGEWLLPVPAIRSASTVAHGNFELDHDGIVRRLASTKQTRDASLIAVPVEAASLVHGTPVPVGRAIAPAFRTPPRSVPVVSVDQLLNDPAAASRIRGRVVFFGPTAQALGDRVLTPVSRNQTDPGVTVHAAATESIIRGDVLTSTPPVAGGLAAAAIVAVTIVLRRSRTKRIAASLALAAAIFAGGLALLALNITIPFATLLLTTIVAPTVAELVTLTTTLRRGQAAARKLESGLGSPAWTGFDEEGKGRGGDNTDVAPLLEHIALRLAEERKREAESKRVLAHELRTPLASMRGLSQLLGGFELSEPERKRVATLLASEAGKLESMVQGLLDIERLSIREFESTTDVVDIVAIAAKRVGFLQASTDRRLELDFDSQPLFVRADASLIERVIDNLVGNALKYTLAPQPVTIRVRHEGTSAAIEVEDRGSGISDADRERIFQRFFRGSAAAGTEGLGLGLALVAEIARWHHGIVALERGSSGGSLFRFTLPAATTVTKAVGARSSAPATPGGGE